MPNIQRTAQDVYIGSDGANTLTIQPDEIVEVSEEKAAQLLADFPDDFKTTRTKPRPGTPPVAAAAEDTGDVAGPAELELDVKDEA